MKKLTLMILLAAFVFGCSKDEGVEPKKSTQLSTPNEHEIQRAKEKLQPIEGWNSAEKTNLTSLNSGRVAAGEVLQISGYYSDGGTYFISGNLNVTGCVPAGQQIYVVYWVYDFAISQWKTASQVSGQCMEDNLNYFVTYYSNNAKTDFYLLAAAQVYIKNAAGQYSLWNTFYSNTIFLNGPF